MIRGIVNARNEAVIPIRVRALLHPGLTVDAIVDTGFDGTLALPASMVAALGVRRRSLVSMKLADESVQSYDVFAVEVFWDGLWQPVLASTIGDEALLGMRLLAGHELRVAVVPGGVVEIAPLP